MKKNPNICNMNTRGKILLTFYYMKFWAPFSLLTDKYRDRTDTGEMIER